MANSKTSSFFETLFFDLWLLLRAPLKWLSSPKTTSEPILPLLAPTHIMPQVDYDAHNTAIISENKQLTDSLLAEKERNKQLTKNIEKEQQESKHLKEFEQAAQEEKQRLTNAIEKKDSENTELKQTITALQRDVSDLQRTDCTHAPQQEVRNLTHQVGQLSTEVAQHNMLINRALHALAQPSHRTPPSINTTSSTRPNRPLDISLKPLSLARANSFDGSESSSDSSINTEGLQVRTLNSYRTPTSSTRPNRPLDISLKPLSLARTNSFDGSESSSDNSISTEEPFGSYLNRSNSYIRNFLKIKEPETRTDNLEEIKDEHSRLIQILELMYGNKVTYNQKISSDPDMNYIYQDTFSERDSIGSSTDFTPIAKNSEDEYLSEVIRKLEQLYGALFHLVSDDDNLRDTHENIIERTLYKLNDKFLFTGTNISESLTTQGVLNDLLNAQDEQIVHSGGRDIWSSPHLVSTSQILGSNSSSSDDLMSTAIRRVETSRSTGKHSGKFSPKKGTTYSERAQVKRNETTPDKETHQEYTAPYTLNHVDDGISTSDPFPSATPHQVNKTSQKPALRQRSGSVSRTGPYPLRSSNIGEEHHTDDKNTSFFNTLSTWMNRIPIRKSFAQETNRKPLDNRGL